MIQEPIPAPVVSHSFEDNWAAWQARGAANDRATKRKLLVLAAILLIFSMAVLNGMWLL